MKSDLLHQSVNLIIQLRQSILQSNIVPTHIAQEIICVGNELDKIQKGEQSQKYIDYSKDSSVQKRIKATKDNSPVKKQSAQCKEVMSKECLHERIFPFLHLYELLQIRLVCEQLKESAEYHIKQRIPYEEKWLAHHLFSSHYLRELKEYLFQQIPKEPWFIYDQLEAKKVIKEYAREPELLKKLRTIPSQFDNALKPLIQIMNGNVKSKNSYFEQYKKLHFKYPLKEGNVMMAIKSLKEIDMKKIKKFSSECYKSLLWIQGLISLYILENIFLIRVNENSHLKEIADFYRFHQNTLNAAKRILGQDQQFVMFLNFNPFLKQLTQPIEQVCQIELLVFMLQYLDLSTLLNLRLVSKSVKDECEKQIKQNLTISIYQFELYKICCKSERIAELGFFNPVFDMCYTFLIDHHRELIHHSNFEYIKTMDDEFTFYVNIAYSQLHSSNNLKSNLIQTQLLKKIKENLNPFNKSEQSLLLSEQALDSLYQLIQDNPKISYNFQLIFPFYLYLKLFIIINRSINPYTEEPIPQQLYNNCRKQLNILYAIGVLDTQSMRDILNEALEYFDLEQKQQLASILNQQFFQIYSVFNQGFKNRETVLQLLTSITAVYDSSFIMHQSQFQLNIPQFETILTENVLSYLSYKDLIQFALVSQQANNIYIQHLKVRVQRESEMLKQFEMENKTLIQFIQKKRNHKPNKEKAFQFITQLTSSDISELRSVVRPNNLFDTFAKPFVILFNLKGNLSSWQLLHKYLLNPQAYTQLQELSAETINNTKMQQIKALWTDFDTQKLEQLSQSFLKLVQWLQGIIILHTYLRRYSLLNENDQLSGEEQQLFQIIDQKQLIIYQAMRYLNNK